MLRRGSERGSVLMLMPAAILIVFMLAAIAVDLSLVFLRQREATSHAVDVANDLATRGLDPNSYREGAGYTLDSETELTRQAEEMARQRLGDRYLRAVASRVDDDTVEVTIHTRVDYVFAGALPGGADDTTVTGRATADAMTG